MRLVTRVVTTIGLVLIASALLRGQGGIASALGKFLAPPAQVIAVRAGRLFDSRSERSLPIRLS